MAKVVINRVCWCVLLFSTQRIKCIFSLFLWCEITDADTREIWLTCDAEAISVKCNIDTNTIYTGKQNFLYKHFLFKRRDKNIENEPKVFVVVPWCRCCSCVWSLQQGSWMSRLREKYLGSRELENLWDKICHLQSRGLCVVGRLLAAISIYQCSRMHNTRLTTYW